MALVATKLANVDGKQENVNQQLDYNEYMHKKKNQNSSINLTIYHPSWICHHSILYYNS